MVNIIIPIYNTEPRLFRQALFSIAAQTVNKYRITIVDDGSTEENYVAYTDIITKMPFEVSYLRTDNFGPGVARNRGLEKNTMCDYIIFMDADDILMPRAVEILYSEAKVNDADIVVSDILIEGKHRTSSGISKLGKNTTWLHGKIYKKSFLDKINLKFLDLFLYNEDVYFNAVAFHLTEKIYYVEESLYIWSYNKDSLTRGTSNFSRIHNIDFYIAYSEAINKIFSIDEYCDISGALGNLYNIEQMENIIRETERVPALNLNYLKEDTIKLIRKQYQDRKSNFIEGITKNALCGKDGVIFKTSLYQWLQGFQIGEENENVRR